MKQLSLGMAVVALFVSQPVLAGDGKDIVKGAAIGGAGGAVAGAIIPGLGVGQGALIGGAGGAVVGALDKDKKHRRWYRDRDGNRYYVNKRGHRVYRD
ncbi:MAG: YMGG-like glycine zipper-containing protein [Sphingomonadaceae bacterium]